MKLSTYAILGVILVTYYFLAISAVTLANYAPAASGTASSGNPTGSQLPAPGRLAPAISLASLDGGQVTLAGLRGQPVLVNFFATWCGPCRSEMPFLQKVANDPGFSQAGFKLIEVNIQEDPATVRDFLDGLGLDLTVLLDSDAVAARAYNVNGIPASFFIDPDGIIKQVKIGAYASLDILEHDVRTLIGSQ